MLRVEVIEENVMYYDCEDCLEAAGANVLCFQCFGDYQGDWWAKVEYNGETGWVTGGYGSCAGCDALEASGVNEWNDDKDISEAAAKFGEKYLLVLMTQEEAESKCDPEYEQEKEVYDFMVANR